jgi:hypothetical protein
MDVVQRNSGTSCVMDGRRGLAAIDDLEIVDAQDVMVTRSVRVEFDA